MGPLTWPAGTVVMLVARPKTWDLRWCCPDYSSGSAVVTDQTQGHNLESLVAAQEPWDGDFSALLIEARRLTAPG